MIGITDISPTFTTDKSGSNEWKDPSCCSTIGSITSPIPETGPITSPPSSQSAELSSASMTGLIPCPSLMKNNPNAGPRSGPPHKTIIGHQESNHYLP